MPNIIYWITSASFLILYACSSIRHALFQSGAFDLGIYDQVVYLMSQKQLPFSSILDFHHMGNHAAWAVYLLSLPYKIEPNVNWLLVIQAAVLSLGAIPTWHLASQAGLTKKQTVTMAFVYLLYPLIFNINLFDFHPEVMSLPVFLAALLAAKLNRKGWFCLCVIFILGCKAVLSLTIIAMGFWLLLFEKRRTCGLFAIVAGISWFLIATQAIIPSFSGSEAAAVERYSYLGNSVIEIANNLVKKPEVLIQKIVSLDSIQYLVLLFLPIAWGLSLQHLNPLVCIIPTLILNILSEKAEQRDLIHQYSLPALPFLLLAVISALAAKKALVQNRQVILIWSAIAFVILAKYGYFGSKYLTSLDNWQATRNAIDLIHTKGGVLTMHKLVPHLSHRPLIKFVKQTIPSITELEQYQYVLLNTRHPDRTTNLKVVSDLANRLKNNPSFQLDYYKEQVYLFERSKTQTNTKSFG
jgi:uncharacterized membrane protein